MIFKILVLFFTFTYQIEQQEWKLVLKDKISS